MVQKINTFLQQWYLFILAVVYLIIGLFVAKDYGIGWDDECSRVYTGYVNYDYIVSHKSWALLHSSEKYHGPFFELILVFFEKAFGLSDTYSIYLMRHIILFLTFYVAVCVFYFLAKKILSKPYAFLASLFLVMSPRIFAESFYNSKDVLFLSFFIFSLYSYVLFLEKKNIKWAIWHGVLTGFLIDIRILGILMPLLTIVYFVILNINQKTLKQNWKSLITYILVSVASIVVCWPVLWEGPILHFSNAFIEMKKFHWESYVRYLGEMIMSTELPWHYLLVWIAISTPLLYLVFFGFGILHYAFQFLKNPLRYIVEQFQFNSVLFFIAAPLFSIIVMKSVVYDGWRHVYFIYPCILLFAVYGVKEIVQRFSSSTWKLNSLYAVIALNALSVLVWMVRNHPYENVYFNAASRAIMPNMDRKFEIDYWGLSYHQAYAYLDQAYPSIQPIKVSVANTPGKDNLLSLPSKLRNRFQYVEKDDSSFQFFLTIYRDEDAPSHLKPVHIIRVDNIPIIGIYQH